MSLARKIWSSLAVAMLATALVVALGIFPAAQAAPASAIITGAASGTCQSLDPVTVKAGSRGPSVVKVQQCLTDLGFMPLGTDGNAGDNTKHAIIAAQKYAGLGRDGAAGAQFRNWAQTAAPVAMPAQCGDVTACVDKARQVLFIKTSDGLKVVDTATGNGATYKTKSGGTAKANTPSGPATICRKIPGLRVADLGKLYSPSYLDYGRGCTGYAIHGSTSVPTSPASHGCARVTLALKDTVYAALPIGAKVTVF